MRTRSPAPLPCPNFLICCSPTRQSGDGVCVFGPGCWPAAKVRGPGVEPGSAKICCTSDELASLSCARESKWKLACLSCVSAVWTGMADKGQRSLPDRRFQIAAGRTLFYTFKHLYDHSELVAGAQKNFLIVRHLS